MFALETPKHQYFLGRRKEFFPSVRKTSNLQIFAVNEDGERKLGIKSGKKRLQMQYIYRNAETEEVANFELYVEVDSIASGGKRRCSL